MLTNAKSVITEFLPITEWMQVVSRDTCQVTWQPGHVSRRTFHAQMERWLNLPFIFLLPLDLMIFEEKIISFFDQRYETCPVIYFYLSSKIFSIYIFNIRIKNSNNGVIYLFTNSRWEGRNEWESCFSLPRSVFEYIVRKFWMLFAGCLANCLLCVRFGMFLLIRKSNYLKLIRGGKWGEV